MKKMIACVVGAMMVLSLAACSPTKVNPDDVVLEGSKTEGESSKGSQSSDDVEAMVDEMIKQQTEIDVEALRAGNPDAPTLDAVTVYYKKDNGTGLRKTMVDVEEATADALVASLIEYGILEEGTTVNSFEVQAGAQAGPGVDPSKVGSGDSIGTLDLSKLQQLEGNEEKLVLYGSANSFADSFVLDKLKILVNGQEYSSSLLTDGYLYPVDVYEKLD